MWSMLSRIAYLHYRMPLNDSCRLCFINIAEAMKRRSSSVTKLAKSVELYAPGLVLTVDENAHDTICPACVSVLKRRENTSERTSQLNAKLFRLSDEIWRRPHSEAITDHIIRSSVKLKRSKKSDSRLAHQIELLENLRNATFLQPAASASSEDSEQSDNDSPIDLPILRSVIDVDTPVAPPLDEIGGCIHVQSRSPWRIRFIYIIYNPQ